MMQRREFLGHMVRTAVAGSTVMAAGRSAWPLADLKLLGEIAVTKAEAVPGSMQLTFDETLSPARTTWE